MKISKNKKKVIFVIALVLVALSVAVGILIKNNSETDKRGPKPKGNTSSNFLYQEIYFDCSKPINGEWTEAGIGPINSPGWYFIPDSESDLSKYCREGAVIEYRAVLDILRREDVSKIIDKYDTTQAWVRSLGHKYIHDKDYLNRILPAYSHMKIDCIIVVHSPEDTRFFIENGEVHKSHNDHRYVEVSSDEFLASLNQASNLDINNFWLGLH